MEVLPTFKTRTLLIFLTTPALYPGKALYEQVAKGDENAFRVLFDHYRLRLLSFVFRLCKSPSASEEILQEVFVKIWQYRERLAEVEFPEQYILAIARNQTYNHLHQVSRDHRRRRQLWSTICESENQTVEQLDLKESQILVQKAVEGLSDQQKEVFRLSRQEGLTHEQIAERLRLSRSRVKNILVEALAHIRRYLRLHISPVVLLLLIPQLVAACLNYLFKK